ncbi:hypothetical protein EDC94DRAFT_610720 [Helicostylum pulchrum]|nr:hypothetical protein EDC94DRAFT_610720 [Helicostylum pulchrum]
MYNFFCNSSVNYNFLYWSMETLDKMFLACCFMMADQMLKNARFENKSTLYLFSQPLFLSISFSGWYIFIHLIIRNIYFYIRNDQLLRSLLIISAIKNARHFSLFFFCRKWSLPYLLFCRRCGPNYENQCLSSSKEDYLW